MSLLPNWNWFLDRILKKKKKKKKKKKNLNISKPAKYHKNATVGAEGVAATRFVTDGRAEACTDRRGSFLYTAPPISGDIHATCR